MGDSCFICGGILAPRDSDNYPSWCKDIGALCWFQSSPIFSEVGYIEDDDFWFVMPDYGECRFDCQHSLVDLNSNFCYPFHTSCMVLLKERDKDKVIESNAKAFFGILQSAHYHQRSRALRWGHNYYFEDIESPHLSEESGNSCQEDIIIKNKAHEVVLADPLRFNFPEKAVWTPLSPLSGLQKPQLAPISNSGSTLASLPLEILLSILCYIDFREARYLLQTCQAIWERFKGPLNLPALFWESRFWIYGETGFANSTYLPTRSRKDWFLTIKFEMRSGPNKIGLQNRERIWKLVDDLVNLSYTTQDPNRILYGQVPESYRPDLLVHPSILDFTASCLASKYTAEGCRELTQAISTLKTVSFKSQLLSITPSYVRFLKKRLISGLSFQFSDGEIIKVGYVIERQENHINRTTCPKVLWVVVSPLGFEAMTLDIYPLQYLQKSLASHKFKIAIAMWSLDDLGSIRLGLDAVRIVKICIEASKKKTFDDILWTPPHPFFARPSLTPFICDDDVTALYDLQKNSFSPASALYIEPEKGKLVAIVVFSPLGYGAGITGIRFIYDTNLDCLWGSNYDAASLIFFLTTAEYLVKVTVYKIKSLICHIQFTTNHVTSDMFPQLPMKMNILLDCISYEALNGGFITGFCGSFVDQQLHCFGVIPTTSAIYSILTWDPPASYSLPQTQPQGIPFGSFKNHGQRQSRLLLLNKRYQSIQASLSSVMTKYRRCGQVTGLLFRSSTDEGHPDLLGQWSEAGSKYNLEEDEQIIGLTLEMVKPMNRPRIHMRLLQVAGITVLTNLRSISWGPSTEQKLENINEGRLIEIIWEYNAVFDRVICRYDD